MRDRKENGRAGVHRTAAEMTTKRSQYSGIDPASVSAAAAADAAWFKANPRRSHRLREMVPGEFPDATLPDGLRFVTAVRQVEPGRRLRVAFGLLDYLPVEDVPEAECCAMFELAFEHLGAAESRPFTVGDIQARAHQEVSHGTH